MGKSGASRGADVGFVPSSAAFLCDLGCSVQSGSQIFLLWKRRNECLLFYFNKASEGTQQRRLTLEGTLVIKSVLYSPYQEELLEAFWCPGAHYLSFHCSTVVGVAM